MKHAARTKGIPNEENKEIKEKQMLIHLRTLPFHHIYVLYYVHVRYISKESVIRKVVMDAGMPERRTCL